MTRCPQCGATVSVPEQELHPTCPFCGTAFLVDGTGGGTHLLVPQVADRRTLSGVVRDQLTRSGRTAPAEPRFQIYYFPFRRTAEGSFLPAFESHVPELMQFRVPGSDWKRFRRELVADGAILLEPEPAGGTVLHSPIARAAVEAPDGERVVWIDAARGRVLADSLGTHPTRSRRFPARLLAAVAATYFGALLVLPLPWSLAAAAAATPFLHRWGSRLLQEAS